jgi:CRP/FNR family cyclic AMP-dependent transcriptional regulator
MFEHFKDADAPRRIRQAIYEQQCVAHHDAVTDALLKDHVFVELKKDDVLITEGEHGNDLYLIIGGTVSVRVKGREMAIRQAGQHVGEMTVIEPSKPRSATVVALEPVAVIKVPEAKFAALADQYPYLWRRLAIELTERLRERHKFVKQPNPRPVIFVGSSVEGLDVAKAIQSGLSHSYVVPQIWTNNVFQRGNYTMEDLEKRIQTADFGVLVCTPDDHILNEDRKVDAYGPRDNVILELGMCIGALGRKRGYMVIPRSKRLKLPTDVIGITALDYDASDPANLAAHIGPVCTEIEKAVKEHGVK